MSGGGVRGGTRRRRLARRVQSAPHAGAPPAAAGPAMFLAPLLLAGLAVLLGPVAAAAQAGSLPAYGGRLDAFTLTPRGDIDGFVLADGTEVKTPPHLSRDIARAVTPGDPVTVSGLKAAALPLIQAVTVTDTATGRTVVDHGPAPRPPAPEEARPVGSPPVFARLEGRVRLPLHGLSGEVNGVLLTDGTVVRLPPPDAARLAWLLAPGRPIVVEGLQRAWPLGRTLEASALGAGTASLAAVGPPRLLDEDHRR